jgi:uncharacterized membrane protein
MRLLKRFAEGELRLGRIESFSDAVFAIVVTLLVLELKVPILHDHTSADELSDRLVDLLPKFLSWLISFIIVCKFWLNHHHLLTFARHATYGMIWLNSIFLMGQAFIPFPTALMGEYPANPLAVSLFGIVMAVNTLLFIALQSYILRNLLKPELVGAVVPHLTRKSFVGVISYLLGVAATLVDVRVAFVLYALTPLFFITPPQPRR